MTLDALGRAEAVVDASGVAARIEALLPTGVRPRQLSVRTLLVGMQLCLFAHRPAHLTRVHAALRSLEEPDRRRLGATVTWRNGPHSLTYRQVERTFSLVVRAVTKKHPDGAPSEALQEILDALVDASIPERFTDASRSLAIDWTDVESFSTRRTKPDGRYADVEAAWGHRKGGRPGGKDELFFGYYLSLATMVTDDGGKSVPELVRAMTMATCELDPVPLQVAALINTGIPLGDVVADSGYAHRVAEHFALPLRAAGASLVIDLHPHDRGMNGTHHGAICHNGNLYCPATPKALFELAPPPRGANQDETAAHDLKMAELSRFKLGRHSATDTDGFHRVACPAVMGKLRCPLRPASLQLSFGHPEILDPPSEPPTCCTNQTITVPPTVNAKTAQKHDYLSKPWRRSFARRTAVERSNARIKDPATIDIARGWCRIMGLTPLSLFVACALAVRNQAVTDAFEQRQTHDQQRARQGLPPLTRHRRRKTLGDLVAASTANAPP